MPRPRRVAVSGSSMVPTLRNGEHVLVVGARPKVGRLAVLRDPRQRDRVLIKRVSEVLPSGEVVVLGDNQISSTDSRVFGAVPRTLFLGRPLYRYAPADVAGWLWFA